jgi:hypothetical protein
MMPMRTFITVSSDTRMLDRLASLWNRGNYRQRELTVSLNAHFIIEPTFTSFPSRKQAGPGLVLIA